MNLPALIAFWILYTHINDYGDFGGNESNRTREQRKRLREAPQVDLKMLSFLIKKNS